MSENPYQTPDTIAVSNNSDHAGKFGPARSTSTIAWTAIILLSFQTITMVLSQLGIYLNLGSFHSLFYVTIGIGLVVSICMWTSKSMINAWATGLPRPTITPGLAAGWYFIPIAWFWKPYVAIKESWENLVGAGVSKALPLTWWFCWIGTSLVQISTNLYFKENISPENYGYYSDLMFIVKMMRTGAAVLLIMIIVKITRGHNLRISGFRDN